MTPLIASWLASIAAAVWLLAVGAIRILAYRSGTDRNAGMRGVAVMALSLGAIAALIAVILSVILVTGR